MDRSDDLKSLQDQIRRLVPKVESARAALGGRLDALGIPAPDPSLADCLRSAAALRRTMERDRDALSRRRALAEEAASLEAGRDAEQADLARRRAAAAALLPDLAAAAYARYLELPDRGPWSALFSPLDAVESESSAAAETLRTLDREEAGKGLIDRMKIKARKVAVRGDAARAGRKRDEAAGRVGEALPGSGFEALAEAGLKRLFDQVASERQAALALEASAARRDARIAELRRELGDDPRAGDRALEQRLEGSARELDVLHAWAGRLLAEGGLEAAPADPDLQARASELHAIEETLAQLRQEVDRLKAEQESAELLRREAAVRERRARLEAAAEDAQRGIDATDLELNRSIRRREDLRRVAAGEIPYVPPGGSA